MDICVDIVIWQIDIYQSIFSSKSYLTEDIRVFISNMQFHFYMFTTPCFFWLSILLNMIIFIDLLMTIRNPFKKRKARRVWYKIIIYSFIFLCFITNIIDNQHDIFYVLTFLVTKIVLMIIPLIISSVIYSLIYREGASQELKQRILKRHFIYLALFLLWELRFFY